VGRRAGLQNSARGADFLIHKAAGKSFLERMAIHPVVAIDGTAASGKSTFSRALAARLGFAYVSTGEMYRGVTWFVQEKGIEPRDEAAVQAMIAATAIETSLRGGELAFAVGGIDPLPHVRDARVNDGVSFVAKVSAVRRVLVAQQQRLAELSPIVMEGRDIGTVVFPQTPYKFYVDADPAVRSQRRAAQGEQDSILQRDVIDSQRVDSPLLCAADAVRLDSGAYRVDELVAQALEQLRARGFEG
jgi:cytidylate kinase